MPTRQIALTFLKLSNIFVAVSSRYTIRLGTGFDVKKARNKRLGPEHKLQFPACCKLTNGVVGPEGFEPSTNGLKGRCSTPELRAHQKAR